MINRSLRTLALTAALLIPATASAHTNPRTLPATLGHPTPTLHLNRHRLTTPTTTHTLSATLSCPC